MTETHRGRGPGRRPAALRGQWRVLHRVAGSAARRADHGGLKGGIALAGFGQPQTTVRNFAPLDEPRFAGSAIVELDDVRRTLDVVGPTGTQTPLGPPSSAHSGSASDADGVAWAFNGCVRYASLTTATTAKSPRDPCPQAEISLYIIGAHSKLHGNHARVPFKCVAAASGRCRGELLLPESAHKPVSGEAAS